MKKLLILFLLLLMLPAAALADTAEDITEQCLINNKEFNRHAPDDMRDDDHITFYTGSAVTINAPEGKTIGSVEIRWRTISPKGVIVKVNQNGKWVEVMRQEAKYAAQYLVLDTPASAVRLTPISGKLELCKVTVLTPGEAPSYIQQWRDAPEKVDMMLFSTHPDDEVLWFGGLLPTYAGEQKKDVLVINAVYGWYYRRQELLDALWACGVDIYPVLLGYPDQQDSMPEILKEWGLKNRQPEDKAVTLIRQYKPDVVVLHDVEGEYGHNAHITFSWLGRQGVERAANASEHAASCEQYGVWDVPKTYIHLWGENQIRMDWHQPLTAFGGKTSFEVASEAFLCHKTQAGKWWGVEEGGEYDNALFGLWRTNVGSDTVGKDLFENIQ
ncbi:MAG: PIG-L family deacetylase [Clostridia bacterium]|nr:PIG-L family deacetylase [Clostridia bacterium]